MADRSDASRVVEKLKSGFPEIDLVPNGSYLVGGCVRDAMLDRPALDVDFAVFSAGEAASRFASRVRSRPIQLGGDELAVWRVTARDRVYDFADVVGDSIEMDLGRRDFTINAMAVALRDVPLLIDPFNGLDDLKARIVRLVSEKNVDDDPLRILRGVRLAVQLDFNIDENSFLSLKSRAGSLSVAAPERVTYELDLILRSPRAKRGLDWIARLGLGELLFGLSLDGPTISVLDSLDGDPISSRMVLAQHLRDRALEAHAKRWRWSTQTLRDVLSLRKAVESICDPGPESIEVVLYDAGPETSRRAVAILRTRGLNDEASRVESILEARSKSLFATVALLTGHEIQELAAVDEGAEVGRLKRLVLEAQIRGEISTREEAVALVAGEKK